MFTAVVTSMAGITQGDEVIFRVITKRTPETDVVNLKILQ